MTTARELELKAKNDLPSNRELRGFYADCGLVNLRSKDLMIAARRAADLGDQKDQQEYESWQRTFGDPDHAKHAP